MFIIKLKMFIFFMKYSPVGSKNEGYTLPNYSKARGSGLMQIGGEMASP
jgi:hypothetical protein